MPDPGNIRRHLNPIGQPNPCNLTNSGVRLFGRSCIHPRTNTAFLRATLQGRRSRLILLVLPASPYKLINRRHNRLFLPAQKYPSHSKIERTVKLANSQISCQTFLTHHTKYWTSKKTYRAPQTPQHTTGHKQCHNISNSNHCSRPLPLGTRMRTNRAGNGIGVDRRQRGISIRLSKCGHFGRRPQKRHIIYQIILGVSTKKSRTVVFCLCTICGNGLQHSIQREGANNYARPPVSSMSPLSQAASGTVSESLPSSGSTGWCWCSCSGVSASRRRFRYRPSPVPAGMSLPMMTFSLSPRR